MGDLGLGTESGTVIELLEAAFQDKTVIIDIGVSSEGTVSICGGQ